ncbi:sulfotransferase [Paracoccus sp. DMF-8]|uniref:sulfotransferase n=1 Tax=Paracoccus sp. DMF-8 TaxID=3019445 RepID=UPI0023E3BF3E|nr:sulfotransferase [Paracoccus sp. DMF-8]MDF3607708.1 sulfotransferase [Paracoccus sp. DMF-8]
MDAAKPRVSFLIVGTQKGGTTALHAMLQAVPDLYLPPDKELHFFDKDADRSDPALARPDRDDMACLNALYRDDITDTAALIGRDLSHWLGTA